MSKDDNLEKVRAQEKLSLLMPGVVTMLTDNFGLNRSVGAILVAVIVLALAGGVFFFVHSAPPGVITITSGPEGSVFYTNACKYAAILERQGVKLNILTSKGSYENLQRLKDASSKVDVGFVQGGITNGDISQLVSLGSISYQPLLVFYRGTPVQNLAALAGRQLAIGPIGSGTRSLVLTLLAANGIQPGDTNTSLLDWDSQKSARALLDGKVDAVFLMGEDASPVVMRKLLLTPDVHLLNFAQAEAYTRRFSYLNLLKFPQGMIDLGKNIPAQDVYLIGPTVELVGPIK